MRCFEVLALSKRSRPAASEAAPSLASRFVGEAGGETPGLLHAFFFDADDGSDGKALRGDEGGLDLLGASVFWNPVLSLSRIAAWVLNHRAFFEADDEIEAEVGHPLEEFSVCESAVTDNGNADRMIDIKSDNIGQLCEELIFDVVALARQLRFANGFPQEHGCTAMICNQIEG